MTMPGANRFKVAGRGSFPIDMLRYDVCWPTTEKAANTIARSFQPAQGEMTVELESTLHNRPTVARWESFGWTVIES